MKRALESLRARGGRQSGARGGGGLYLAEAAVEVKVAKEAAARQAERPEAAGGVRYQRGKEGALCMVM